MTQMKRRARRERRLMREGSRRELDRMKCLQWALVLLCLVHPGYGCVSSYLWTGRVLLILMMMTDDDDDDDGRLLRAMEGSNTSRKEAGSRQLMR